MEIFVVFVFVVVVVVVVVACNCMVFPSQPCHFVFVFVRIPSLVAGRVGGLGGNLKACMPYKVP